MQIKLWDKNKLDLIAIAQEPAYKSIKVSVARIANMAIDDYIERRKVLKMARDFSLPNGAKYVSGSKLDNESLKTASRRKFQDGGVIKIKKFK